MGYPDGVAQKMVRNTGLQGLLLDRGPDIQTGGIYFSKMDL